MFSEGLTIGIIVFVTIALILYDIVVAFFEPRGDTITQVIQKYSQKYPVIPFVFGFLMGHFYGDF